jgi:hypothetical protein
MPFPVRPSDFENIIVTKDDSLGAGMVKVFIRLPILVYRLVRYMFEANGSFTQEFKDDLCALDCANPTETEEGET